MLNRSKLVTLLVCLVCWPALAWGQQEMRSASKGASTPLPITGSAIDADHNALDVKCLSGCSGSGGGGGGAVQSLTLASEITTNTTSTVVQGVSGSKTFWFELSGTGAVSVDMTIYGARTSNPTADELEVLCTYAGLAGTDKTVGTCNGASTTSYPYYAVGTANISGTNASVSVYAFY